jgi:hypothetical protein
MTKKRVNRGSKEIQAMMAVKTPTFCVRLCGARETFLAKLTEIQQTVEQLLAQLQASEYAKFAAHPYRSRREYRAACERSGKGGKQTERCLISTFQVAESMGFKGDFRQWEHLLRIGD